MKVTQNKYCTQIIIFPGLLPINCYLVEEENELTLVDAGIPFCKNKIIEVAKKLGKPITTIVLTHAHEDHIGAVVGVKQVFPDATLAISQRDSRLLQGDKTVDLDEPQTPIRGGVPKKFPLKPDRLLMEGDQIGSLVVYATPGHTPGSISLLDQRTHALLVGDAFQTQGRVAVTGEVVGKFPLPAWATWHRKTALESAAKLIALRPSLLASGHGEMVINPIEAMKLALERGERQWHKKEN